MPPSEWDHLKWRRRRRGGDPPPNRKPLSLRVRALVFAKWEAGGRRGVCGGEDASLAQNRRAVRPLSGPVEMSGPAVPLTHDFIRDCVAAFHDDAKVSYTWRGCNRSAASHQPAWPPILNNPQALLARNGVTRCDVKDIALDRDVVIRSTHVFSTRVPAEGKATSQKSSGRCWLFAALNRESVWARAVPLPPLTPACVRLRAEMRVGE